MNELQHSILEFLNENGPSAVTEIASHVEAHPVQVDLQCEHLHDYGHIVMYSGGVYELTDRGVDRLTEST